MSMRNYYKTRDSKQIGDNAVVLFDAIATGMGYKITPATRNQDIYEHFDRILQKDGKKFTVQIKSKKRVSSSDANLQDEFIWVQYQSVHGHPGWMFGKADYIALQMTSYFLLIKRQTLLSVADSLIDKSKVVFSTNGALYKLYQRIDNQYCADKISAKDLRQKVLAKDKMYIKCHRGLVSLIKSSDIIDNQNVTFLSWPK